VFRNRIKAIAVGASVVYTLAVRTGDDMNTTLSVDEQVAQHALQAAHGMGKSLNQVVRDDLEQLAGIGIRVNNGLNSKSTA
jgi:hypothetical protein